MDYDALYPWMTILRAKYMGSSRARTLVERFGSLTKAMKASHDELAAVPGFNEKIAASIVEASKGKFDREIERELYWLEKNQARILLHSDPEYPEPLRHIPAAPAMLYVKGTLRAEDILSFGIVGTRRATDAGKRTANRIANELAEAGLTITSGLAWGVDAAAHKGALKCKSGRTLAVLGNGLKFCYPKEHQSLADQIEKRGARITEVFHDVPPDGRNFPPRNRIISGLSLGVLIVEAPERSGALITAKYALEQGREIFALPGALDEETGKGVNRLIQNSEAQLITCADDILRELGDKIAFYKEALQGNISKLKLEETLQPPENPPELDLFDNKPEPPSSTETRPQKSQPNLSGDEQTVYEALTDKPQHIDDLTQTLGWPLAKVSSVLGMLELKGHVLRTAGMRFSRDE